MWYSELKYAKGVRQMKKYMAALLAAVMLWVIIPAAGAEEVPVPIHTVQDLLDMAQNPEGSYILMEDLDLAGIPWKGLDFSGTFDGNGHALLNLTLTEVGDIRLPAYDGNAKSYDAAYLGFFSTLRNAQVKDLKLINVRSCLEINEPCFVGALAGYAEEASITGCTVTGTLELRAFDRIFGIGGMVGYGSGAIQGCTMDMTLICVDTDATTLDEQFLGGAYATGYINVQDCSITLAGFVSEHGYVHSGGVVGMYMKYPLGKGTGYITGNQISGKITFFEDNKSRRAYCEAIVGESLVSPYVLRDNTQEFIRDERQDVTVELRPEMCENPVYEQTVVPGDCHNFGYSLYTCVGCGYTYRDDYTLCFHSTETWQVEKPATVEEEGVSIGNCDGCGLPLKRTDPKLEPEPIPEPTETQIPVTQPAQEQLPPEEETSWLLPVVIAAGLAALVAVLAIAVGKRKKS